MHIQKKQSQQRHLLSLALRDNKKSCKIINKNFEVHHLKKLSVRLTQTNKPFNHPNIPNLYDRPLLLHHRSYPSHNHTKSSNNSQRCPL